jgi:hypothetical protein
VEQIIRGPTNNHALKNSKNWRDVQGQVELHIRQMHISWKQGIHKSSHTLLDCEKKILCCLIRLRLGAVNNVYKIPLYPTFF